MDGVSLRCAQFFQKTALNIKRFYGNLFIQAPAENRLQRPPEQTDTGKRSYTNKINTFLMNISKSKINRMRSETLATVAMRVIETILKSLIQGIDK